MGRFAARCKEHANAGAGGIYGCRDGAGRWGWDVCMYGSRTPRVQVCHSRYWAREGVGGSAREAVCTSTAAGGGLSAAARRSSLLGGHDKVAQNMTNEQDPPKVRASAKKFISTKRETCTKDDTTERGGWASSQKLPALCATARAWCINMHQLGVLHSLLPPKNSLDPPTHRLTRGAMGAGSP